MKFRENDYQNGDTLYVRLQVNDRVVRNFVAACAPDKIFNCAIDPARPTCFQWVTWRVDFKPLRDM